MNKQQHLVGVTVDFTDGSKESIRVIVTAQDEDAANKAGRALGRRKIKEQYPGRSVEDVTACYLGLTEPA